MNREMGQRGSNLDPILKAGRGDEYRSRIDVRAREMHAMNLDAAGNALAGSIARGDSTTLGEIVRAIENIGAK